MQGVYEEMLANPVEMAVFMLVTVAIGVIVVRAGLQKGIERVTKVMMAALFVVLAVLCVRAVTLPGAGAGLEFYLMPDFGKLFAGSTPAEQWSTFAEAVYAAMGQAFFMVSVGAGSMSIFGSYIGKERSLTGEALNVAGLDVLVARDGGPHHLPGVLRLRRGAGGGAGAGVRHAAERVRPDVGRGRVGHPVLLVHELRSAVHGHRRVRDDRELLHGPVGFSARAGRPWRTVWRSRCSACRAFWASTCGRGSRCPA